MKEIKPVKVVVESIRGATADEEAKLVWVSKTLDDAIGLFPKGTRIRVTIEEIIEKKK